MGNLLMHARSFNGFVVVGSDDILDTIPQELILDRIIGNCKITEEILSLVDSQGFYDFDSQYKLWKKN